MNKQTTTFALDIRRTLLSLRPSHCVLVLIAAPFFLALYLQSANPRQHASVQQQVPSAAPSSFDQFSYSNIRNSVTQPPPVKRPISIDDYYEFLDKRRRDYLTHNQSHSHPQLPVSLIAACMDRNEILSASLSSWAQIPNLHQIVIVDWASNQTCAGLPQLQHMLQTGNVSLIHVQNTQQWALSRAYNLAASFATGDYLLKVDCDTTLNSNFLATHPLPQPGHYYTVAWGTERNTNEEKLRGVWMASREDFASVGGYDERIVEYGFEDTDLYNRFNTLASLKPVNFNLDTMRHNVAGHLIWARDEAKARSQKLSTRMNRAVIEKGKKWLDAIQEGLVTKYKFQLDEKTAVVYANITNDVPNGLEILTDEQRGVVRVEVLDKTLHDEHKVPWDILPDLSVGDLEFLAQFLGRNPEARLLVVALNGPDILANLFNLVSALQLGMTLGRPVVAIWDPQNGPTIDQSKGTVIEQLLDLEATNVLLEQAANTSVTSEFNLEATRLISTKRWPCVEELSECARKYDNAYSSFSEITMRTARIYDETNPVPLSILKHGFLRLSDKTKIGNVATRAQVFKALVPSRMVRMAQQEFATDVRVAVVMGETAMQDVDSFEGNLLSIHKDSIRSEKDKLAIVGNGHSVLRRRLQGKEQARGFCVGSFCTIEQMAREFANVLAVCRAKDVFPRDSDWNDETWSSGSDLVEMMVADLRQLHKQ